ncbi:MAG: 4-alpha-glucanotransferase [Candidatus Omnitrophica bacterium]|nr:4-alpha-glucanotransferase [Candidatus Omnitrophota bacterium]
MIKERASGILCHISSLPSSFGVGDIGPEAFKFIDFLARAGQKYWQILPLNPTDSALGNSPYSSFSAFAFNILFLSPEALVKDGFLNKEALVGMDVPEDGQVHYDQALTLKQDILTRAYEAYKARRFQLRDVEAFYAQQDFWLHDYALFVVLKRKFSNVSWAAWPREYRDRDAGALVRFAAEEAEAVGREKFGQYLFYRQWMGLQGYASAKGVGFVGDIPIYVNYDSVDVWVHSDLFKLDKKKDPVMVAGVPPDYFSEDGQRWGNPVYDWARLEQTHFSWWVQRIKHNLALFDVVRIDHFRAFAQCWEIPAEELTAKKGKWCDVPGVALFETLQKEIQHLPIIAEDLGIITPDVDALKEQFGLPGMRVLLFAFHNEYKKSRDLPDNYVPFSIVYTGTHDNNTIRGWYDHDITPVEKKNLVEYMKREIRPNEICRVYIEMAQMSASVVCVVPVQDLLGFGEEARMNKPSTIKGNWQWRLNSGALTLGLARYLAAQTIKAGR